MISPVSCRKDQSIFSQIINLCTKEPVNRSDIVVEPLLSPDDYLDSHIVKVILDILNNSSFLLFWFFKRIIISRYKIQSSIS